MYVSSLVPTASLSFPSWLPCRVAVQALSLMKRAQRASAGSADMMDASAWRCLFAGLARQGLHEEAGMAMRAMVDAGIRVDKVRHDARHV